MKEDCKKNDITLDEKFNKLSAIIQNFEKQNGNEDYDYLRNNCINLKDAIKSYFNGKEETFYTQILPFIIDQALLIEERAKNKYGEQTAPLMPMGKAMKISFPKILLLSMISNNFLCKDKDRSKKSINRRTTKINKNKRIEYC